MSNNKLIISIEINKAGKEETLENSLNKLTINTREHKKYGDVSSEEESEDIAPVLLADINRIYSQMTTDGTFCYRSNNILPLDIIRDHLQMELSKYYKSTGILRSNDIVDLSNKKFMECLVKLHSSYKNIIFLNGGYEEAEHIIINNKTDIIGLQFSEDRKYYIKGLSTT